MGVIFRKEVRVEPLTHAIAGAISEHMESALAAPPPHDAQAMQHRARDVVWPAAQAAAKVAKQPPTKGGVNWKPFFISLGLFFVLLAIAIVLDWSNIVDDPTVYTGMVTTVLGAVLGFLGGDAAGTATS